jgi:hypothetical protein
MYVCQFVFFWRAKGGGKDFLFFMEFALMLIRSGISSVANTFSQAKCY